AAAWWARRALDRLRRTGGFPWEPELDELAARPRFMTGPGRLRTPQALSSRGVRPSRPAIPRPRRAAAAPEKQAARRLVSERRAPDAARSLRCTPRRIASQAG